MVIVESGSVGAWGEPVSAFSVVIGREEEVVPVGNGGDSVGAEGESDPVGIVGEADTVGAKVGDDPVEVGSASVGI